MRSHWIQMNPHAIYLKKVGGLNTETDTERRTYEERDIS